MPAMPEKSLLACSESARRNDRKKKTLDDGCSEQTFTKTCLKKFPRLKVKADVQKTIHEALFGLEGNKEGSKWLPTVKDSARFPEIRLIRSIKVLHRRSAGAESRVYLSLEQQLQPASRVTRGA